MHIIICGAGEVGSHAAETLAAAGESITVIDLDPGKLRDIEETMDVATLAGDCANAATLQEAGARTAELVLAATSIDEVNLVSASIAKEMGAARVMARVHHAAYFGKKNFDYGAHFRIDQLICPEYVTAIAIARRLRVSAAGAIESFARGQIEMQEITATDTGLAIGKRLQDVKLPAGARLTLIRRGDQAYIPTAKSVVVAGDTLILVANADEFEEARKQFTNEKPAKRKVVLMGGPPMAVWLCEQLKAKHFAIRLFERDRGRAEELAEKLDWVTVINADPTNRSVFDEENLGLADVFIAMLEDDEDNIIGSVLAKTRGVETVVAVVQESKYLDIIYDIGIDQAFSTRHVAAQEIENLLDERAMRHLGSLAEGKVDVYRVRIDENMPAAGKALRGLALSPDWVVAAIQRGIRTFVPGADDVIEANDVVLVVGKHGKDATLQNVLTGK